MKKLVFVAALALLSVIGRAQGIGVYIIDYDGDSTNVRNAPKGKRPPLPPQVALRQLRSRMALRQLPYQLQLILVHTRSYVPTA